MNTQPSHDGPQGIDVAPLDHPDSDVNSQTAGRSVDIVRFLLANWPKLVAGFGIGLAAGVAFYVFTGHRYDASTRILVSKLAGTPLQEGEATTYGDRAEHVQLIKSDVIIRRAYEEGHLKELPTLAGSEEPVRDLIEDLKVKRSAGQDRSFMNFFDISYQSSSKKDAATVVAAVVDAYEKYLAETREEQSQEVLNLISEAENSLQAEIEQLKQEYQEFRKNSPILFHTPVGKPTGTGSVTLTPPNHYLAAVDQLYKEQRENQQRRTNVQAQIDVLKAMQEEGESRKAIEQYVMMSMAQRSSGGQSGGGASNPLLSVNPAKDRLDTKLLEARIREANLVHHFGDQHPEVEKLRKTITGIHEAYSAEGIQSPAFDRFHGPDGTSDPVRDGVDLAGVYMKYLEEQLRQLDLSDRSVARQLSEAIAQAKQLSEYEVVDKQLSDELQRKQSLWDGIVAKLNLVDFTKEQTGFRMTRISDILVELSIKRVIKVVGAFGMFGALCVFGLVYLREWQDTTVRSLDEVRRFTESTVMGVVPHFAVDPLATPNGGLSESLCYFHKPGSREAEAYRSVRTALFFGTSQQNDCVIQVSSPEPGDGKTTSVANLAIAVAQSGKRVLLIDADLRRPTLHQLFGLPQDVGLSDVLRHDIEWINAVRDSGVNGLSVLTSGQTPENPAELLSTSDLPTILRAARSEFDYVFVDTPPLLAVSDPCIISPHVDGMVLVVRMQKNKRPAIIRTKDMLNAHGIELYGIVANDMGTSDPSNDEFGSYAEYYNTGPARDMVDSSHPPAEQPALTTNVDPA